ncbi:sigma 54-interacting transcriptional regulator [Planctomycetota bacterium]
MTPSSGTGKQLLAEHAARKAERPRPEKFLEVNLAHYGFEEFRSEMFGYAKGAYTGAGKDSLGRFREYDGGTVFLDEVNHADDRVRASLLRFLDSGEIAPRDKEPAVVEDLYVVAACSTTEGMSPEFQQRFHRVDVPPLRDRVIRYRRDGKWCWDCDLFHIAAEVVRGAGQQYIRKSFLREAAGQWWPGNVREFLRSIPDAPVSDDGVIYIGWPGMDDPNDQLATVAQRVMGQLGEQDVAKVVNWLRSNDEIRGLVEAAAVDCLHVDAVAEFAADVFEEHFGLYLYLRGLRARMGMPMPDAVNPLLAYGELQADLLAFLEKYPEVKKDIEKQARTQAISPLPTAPSLAAARERKMRFVVEVNDWNLSKAREAAEREFLRKAMATLEGTQKDRAGKLGISPGALSTRLKKHGLR